MKIASVLASYQMAEADKLRKAMGKKIQELMAQHRERFQKGAEANGISPEKAAQIFSLMEKFGGYGFNKSHSAAYALIAYQTAYLKTHYPVEFLASLLTSEMHSIDGVVKFIAECRSHEIEVLPPDINRSYQEFTVDGGRIRFGLVAVKNVGEGAIDAIVEARQEKEFTSLFDFCERVDLRKVNRRVVESLIKCGAFDCTAHKRSQMMASLETALDYGQRIQKEKNDLQMSLFGNGPSQPAINVPPMAEITEWDEKRLLASEKDSLGFYLSGHPLKRYRGILEKFCTADSISVKENSNGGTVRIGGLVRSTKIIKTRRGDLMAFAAIEDLHGTIEVTVFSRLYQQTSELLVEDQPVLVHGQLQRDEQSVKIVAETLIPIEKAEETWTASVHLNLELARSSRETLAELHAILRRHPGGCRGYLHLRSPDNTDAVIALPDSLNLKAGEPLQRDVNEFLGYRAVETRCDDAGLTALRP
jgi:DNA polymerase-3 subunit alpha